MAIDRNILGVHCGWAGDGIDAAVIKVAGRGRRKQFKQLFARHVPFSTDLRVGIDEALAGNASPPRLAQLDAAVSAAFVEAAETAIRGADTRSEPIAAVGCSQQPIAADPGRVVIGDPAALGAGLGLPVIAGAVESAKYDAAFCSLRDMRLSRVLLHLGGIIELTVIPAASYPGDLMRSAVGPGMLVLDALARKHFKMECDADGAIAARGSVSPPLLNELESHPFFMLPLPRPACAASWLGPYLQRLVMQADSHRCGPEELVATFTELIARQIAVAVAQLTERPHETILVGGGAKNIHLVQRIRALLSPSSTYPAERYGFSVRGWGAACMAGMAADRLDAANTRLKCRPDSSAGLWLP
jgi:anhydro-N-acetylmuramic acid kinase